MLPNQKTLVQSAINDKPTEKSSSFGLRDVAETVGGGIVGGLASRAMKPMAAPAGATIAKDSAGLEKAAGDFLRSGGQGFIKGTQNIIKSSKAALINAKTAVKTMPAVTSAMTSLSNVGSGITEFAKSGNFKKLGTEVLSKVESMTPSMGKISSTIGEVGGKLAGVGTKVMGIGGKAIPIVGELLMAWDVVTGGFDGLENASKILEKNKDKLDIGDKFAAMVGGSVGKLASIFGDEFGQQTTEVVAKGLSWMKDDFLNLFTKMNLNI